MDESKKRAQEIPKLVETITFRTTAERKLKLTQKAVELGKPLSVHCEDLICNPDEFSEKENPEIKSNQMKKLYEMLDEILERNSKLQEQITTLTEQPKPIIEIEPKSEKEKTNEEIKSVTSVNISESFIKAIVNAAPEKDRAKFEIRLNKLCDYRMKSGKAKTKEEAIYQCVMYCIQFGAFFDAG